MGGGAWPFLVGGAICLVNSDNERDSSLLNRLVISTGCISTWVDLDSSRFQGILWDRLPQHRKGFLEGQAASAAARNGAITGL